MPRPTHHDRGTGPSQRQLRVGEELRHVMVDVFHHAHFRDPELEGVSVTVTQVKVSPDLRNATVFVMPLGGRNVETVIAALNRARAYLRGEMGHRLNLRHTPDISFRRDESFEEAGRIERILRSPEVRRDVEADGEAGSETGGEG